MDVCLLRWFPGSGNPSPYRDLGISGGGQKFRVVRGASWDDGGRGLLRSGFRCYIDPRQRHNFSGFRVVLAGS